MLKAKVMIRKLFILLCFVTVAHASDNIRTFPAKTIFGTLQGVDAPKIEIQEIPKGVASGMLGAVLLHSQTLSLSPSTVIRDQHNVTHVQSYLNTLYKQPVGIQPDFQGRAWVIWQLTETEKMWVITNGLNIWK